MSAYYFLPALLMVCPLASCSPSDAGGPTSDTGSNGNLTEINNTVKIRITIGSDEYTATLRDNATAATFREMLPLTIQMEDVNRNEKYGTLGRNLPVAAENPNTIQSGDLMLWGSDGLVLFYKTFTSSYSYSPLGRIDNPAGLESALGSGAVRVNFDIPE